MKSSEDYSRLIAQVDDLRLRWRVLQVAEGTLRTLAAVAVLVVAVVAVDNLWKVEPSGRWLLLATLATGLVLSVATWMVRRWLDDRRDDYFAAVVEQSHPELRNRLINGLQLGRGNDYGSPRLIEAIVHDAVQATADLDLAGSLDRHPAKRAALALAVAFVVLAGYAGLMAPRFMNGLARVLAPLAEIPPYTATQVASVKPGDKQVLEGLAVPVEAQLTGRMPGAVQIFLRSGDKPWRTMAMKSLNAKGGDRFGFTIREANQTFDYYVEAGDGRSREYRVEVVQRPRIDKLTVSHTPPAYTGRDKPVGRDKLAKRAPARNRHPAGDSQGEVAALCGSSVTLRLRATKPLKEATLLLDAGEPLVLSKTGDDRTWQGSFVIWSQEAADKTDRPPSSLPQGRLVKAPSRYQVRLLATDGSDYTDPLWRSVTATVDQPPSLTILAPARDMQVRPEEQVALELLAKDDYGLGPVSIKYRVNDEMQVRELRRFAHDGRPRLEVRDRYEWNLASGGLQAGDVVQYWAEAEDRNNITGPGTAKSRTYSLFIKTPEQALANLELEMDDYAQVLEELVRLQSENRAQTAAGVSFETLVVRETLIRTKTLALVRVMERDAAPLTTMTESLNELYSGLMADCIRLLEAGRDTADQARSSSLRGESLPVQDEILKQLRALLERLQRNDQARKELKKLAKTDQASHAAVVDALSDLMEDLDRLLVDETELANQFEKLPKKPVDEANDEALEAMADDLEEFEARWHKWAKGTVDELTKLPAGFVDDFGLREDVNSVFEEIEKAANRAKASKLEVALEDLGAGMATKMLEDLEVWMADTPEALQWVLEEPLSNAPLQVPEMPLPDALEDMVGDLLQEAEEFDEEADDITSAWGDNLNQAGWGVADGPISNFSAKGKTGNELPNNMEVSGRSGDGRRGKSSGQMVGDTARGLQGRKTPARVGAERYEPGQLKEEAHQDPGGATGGGKKAGSGRRGLQGGTPPDFVRDMQRLSEKQAGLRERAEQVAQRLETAGVSTTRLTGSIQLLKSAEDDLRDLRYDDAARKRRVALGQLKDAFSGPDQATAAGLSRARDLPAEMRDELMQSADEGYPEGYEALLTNYFRSLSEAEH